MSDPIEDILTDLAMRLIDSYGSGPPKGYSYDPPAMIIDNAAKQIRQQIGRELLKARRYTGVHGYCVAEDDIREVCQLEE